MPQLQRSELQNVFSFNSQVLENIFFGPYIYIIKEKVSNDDFTGVFNNAMQQHERSNNAHKCRCGCQQEASIYDYTPFI